MSNYLLSFLILYTCIDTLNADWVTFSEDCQDPSEWDINGTVVSKCNLAIKGIWCIQYICQLRNDSSMLTRSISGKFADITLTYTVVNMNLGTCVSEYSIDNGIEWITLDYYTNWTNGDSVLYGNHFITYDYRNSDQILIRFRNSNASYCSFSNIKFNGTLAPTINPTSAPTSFPTMEPTLNSIQPTLIPTLNPSISNLTSKPTSNPTGKSNGTIDIKAGNSSVTLKVTVFIAILAGGCCLACIICAVFTAWMFSKSKPPPNPTKLKSIMSNSTYNSSINPSSQSMPDNQHQIHGPKIELPHCIPTITAGDVPEYIHDREGSIHDSYKNGDTIRFSDKPAIIQKPSPPIGNTKTNNGESSASDLHINIDNAINTETDV